jgi:hypothetical protein
VAGSCNSTVASILPTAFLYSISVTEPQFYAAPGENFDEAPLAPAPTPNLLYSN